jgi:hypothetical protein
MIEPAWPHLKRVTTKRGPPDYTFPVLESPVFVILGKL